CLGTAAHLGQKLRGARAKRRCAAGGMQARRDALERLVAPPELLQQADLVEQVFGLFGSKRARLREVRGAVRQSSRGAQTARHVDEEASRDGFPLDRVGAEPAPRTGPHPIERLYALTIGLL